jgi:spermidine/putrescine transport system ATP-binding protein
LYLETDNGQEIRVQMGHDALEGLPVGIGQRLYAHFSPADGHLVAEA